MTIALCLVSLIAAALPTPDPGTTPANAVDFHTVRELALRKARAEWPGNRLGTVIPYVDETGATEAYMFHFRTDGREFPDQDQVRADVLADRERLTVNTSVKDWKSGYGFILVSARYDRPPFVFYGYGSSEFYAIGEQALARARSALGPGAMLTRIYFVECRTFLEFGNEAGENVIYSSHFEQTWRSRQEFGEEVARYRARLAAAEGYDVRGIERVHRREWEEALARDFTDFTEYYVPQVNRAPFYDWSYGCTPTSGAMVLGYIDRTQNYGRLVDYYWQRWDGIEGQTDWQIPNIQRECAIAMRTDTVNRGGTYVSDIATGLRNAANGNDNSYSFSVTEQYGSSGNDWAWSTITGQIGNGRGFIWSAMWESHSLACFGYRTPEKDVYVHNTWWAPGVWWHYSGSSQSHVASPQPSGGDVRRCEVTYPLGDTFYSSTGRGEILQVGDTVNVTWTNYGNPGTKIDIEISVTGGRYWQSLASNVPDNGSYKWYVSPSLPACDSVRLRLKQYNGSTLTAGDASFGNFYVNREPLAPVFLGPPNGQQLFTPPVVLTVDSLYKGDSLDFRLMYGTDTLLRYKTTDWRCPVPDTMLVYGRSYKWTCRAHNQYGWGKFGTQWSFWVRFYTGVGEDRPGSVRPRLVVPGVHPLGRELSFELAGHEPGARLVIYDALGTAVRELSADRPSVNWDMRDQAGRLQPAGLYFVQMLGTGRAATAKFVLVD